MLQLGLPEDVAPLLTDVKVSFALRRWLQTCLGGIRLTFSIRQKPMVYILQVLVLLVPPVCGVILSISTGKDKFVCGYIFSIAMCGFVGTLQTIAHAIRYHDAHSKINTEDSMDDGNEVDIYFDSISSSRFINFVLPAKSILEEFIHLSMTFFLAFATMYMLWIPDIPSVITDSVFLKYIHLTLGWYLYTTAQFVLSAKSNVELNQWVATQVKKSHINEIQRAIYVILLCLAHQICIALNLNVLNLITHSIYMFLPLLFNLGIAPQIDIFLQYLIEHLLLSIFGYCIKTCLQFLLISFVLASTFISLSYVVMCYVDFELSVGMILIISYIQSRGYIELSQYWRYNAQNTNINTKSFRELISKSSFSIAIISCSARSFVMDTISLLVLFTLPFYVENIFVLNIWRSITTYLLPVTGTLNGVAVLISTISRPYIMNKFRNPFFSTYKFGWLESIARCLNDSMRICSLIYIIEIAINQKEAFLPSKTYMCTLNICCLFHALHICFSNPKQIVFEVVLLSICDIKWHSSTLFVLLLIDIIFTRCILLVKKAQFVLISFWSITTFKTLRFRGWLIASTMLLPVSVISIFTSSLFLSPLMPFCGTNIFLMTFPRPNRFWSSISVCMNGADCNFYRYLLPSLLIDLNGLVSSFQLKIHDGQILLLRIDKMIMFVQVLQVGFGSFTISVKGLELQEVTSCHHKEADKIDNIFENAFHSDKNNCDYFHSLKPLIMTDFNIYSSSNMKLSGVFDDSACINLVSKTFWFLLVYTINKHISESHEDCIPLDWKVPIVPYSEYNPVGQDFPSEWFEYLRTVKATKPPRAIPINKIVSLKSTTDNFDLVSLKTDHVIDIKKNSIDNLINELIPEDSSFRPRSKDCSKSSKNLWNDLVADDAASNRSWDVEGDMVAGKESIRSLDSYEILPPSKQKKKWCGLKHVKNRNLNFPFAPVDEFYKLICTCYMIVEVLGYSSVEDLTRTHILNCFEGKFPSCIERDWLLERQDLLNLVKKAYRFSVKLALDSFVSDDFNFCDDFPSLLAEIETLEEDWYIGPRREAEWKKNMEEEKPKMYSLEKLDTNCLQLHILSINSVKGYIGELNSESCYGIWASLALELLYLTNDDDERYSIQSHPLLLRNLITQAANAPLGYPVFSTGPIMLQF